MQYRTSSVEEIQTMDKQVYHAPELKKIGNVNQLTQGAVDPISGEPGTQTEAL